MIKRLLEVQSLLGKKGSCFLFGARGTGKTVLAHQWLAGQPGSYAINLLEEKSFLRYLNRPGLLREELEAIPQGKKRTPLPVLIDEVQRVPALLNEVHALMNDFPGRFQFILTGSSARKLRRGGANLLAGRAYVTHLHPLTHREGVFRLKKALQYGTLPGLVLTGADPQAYLEAYVSTYLKEEIQQEALVRKLDGFVRFLELAAQLHGEPVNFSKMARQGIASSPTVQDYFSILVDTLVAFRLDGWASSVKRQLLQAPKYYFFDPGVLNSLRGELQVDLSEASFRFGRLFETWVILEAIRLNDYVRTAYKFAYWRTNSGLEVDLILYRNTWTAPIAIEIKSSENPDEKDLSGLKAFMKDYPKAKAYCFCRAPRRRLVGKITILPWQEGLEALFPPL